MKPRCLFSVIIAVRNGAATLPRALDSLFSQTHAEWECLIHLPGLGTISSYMVALSSFNMKTSVLSYLVLSCLAVFS